MSDSLWPHGLQHARPPCPSPTPRVYSNSRPLSQWCHLTISSSSPSPASGSFQMSQFFESGGQRIGVSASASVLPMNTQDWFPLGWTGWISLQSKGLSSEVKTLSHVRLCDPMDCSLPSSSIHRILQARILEWVAISFSRGSSWPRDRTHLWATREAPKSLKSLLQHHSSKASTLWHSAFFTVQLSHPYMTTGKTTALSRWTFVSKVMSLLFSMCLGWA